MQGVQINCLAFYGEKTLIKFETLSLTKNFVCEVKLCLVKGIDRAVSKIIDEVAPGGLFGRIRGDGPAPIDVGPFAGNENEVHIALGGMLKEPEGAEDLADLVAGGLVEIAAEQRLVEIATAKDWVERHSTGVAAV